MIKILDGFDRYSRTARLYPALLLTLPLVITAACLYKDDLFSEVSTLSLSIFAYCGGLYFVSDICRNCGKKLDSRYFRRWGGMPTTVILRHRNNHLNSQEKQRYHQYFAKNVPNIAGKFPSRTEEQNRPHFADEIYSSAVSWLREQRRDKEKYNLVHEELIQYGFRRNLVGVKPYGITVCILSLTLLITSLLFDKGSIASSISEILALVQQRTTVYHVTCFSFTIIALICWITTVNEAWVKEAAYNYAKRLIRSIDRE